MYNATEQFAELNKANVAQATKLAALAIENAEKLTRLNLDRREGRARARRRRRARPPRRSRTCRTSWRCAPSTPNRACQAAIGYSKSLYEIAAEAQAQYSAFAEEAWGAYTKGVASWVDKASKAAPAGSDAGFNALKSTVAATTAAFDQFQKATKQVVSLADASVRAAAANATKTAPKGRSAA